QHAFGVEVLRFGRLGVGLVVQGDVEVHVLRVLPEHACQAAFDDVGDLVGERGVVSAHRGGGGGQQQRMPVGVLQALARQGGASGGGLQDEATGHLVGRSSEDVNGVHLYEGPGI